ncbi:MAG: hypothetical protein ABW048_14505 [Sphingobium sp.]
MTAFKLANPVKFVLSGVHGPRREVDISEITLRPVRSNDLRLLEEFKGQPASLALYGTAALSGHTVAQVKKIDIDDYAPIAVAVLRALAAASARIGIRPEFFIDPDALSLDRHLT